MSRLRSLFATSAAVTLLTGATVVGTATAAEAGPAMEPGCAHVVGYGPGYADIWNECYVTIRATVEVDGFDPPCIRIGPRSTGRIGLEAGDEPYYAYVC